jgi:hypothetical protein
VFEVKRDVERLKAQGGEGAADKLKELEQYVGDFGVKRAYLYNAVAAGGNVVILNMPKTAHDILKSKIYEAVTAKKFDPVNPSTGVWFEFNKTGVMFQTKYAVDFKKISVDLNGELLEKLDRSPLPEDLVKAVAQQVATGGSGPLHDIHKIYDPMTAVELSAVMNGGPIPNKRQENPTSPAAAATTTPSSTTVVNPTVAGVTAPTLAKGQPAMTDIAAEIARLRALQGTKPSA